MESILLTTLTANEEANFSGGKKSSNKATPKANLSGSGNPSPPNYTYISISGPTQGNYFGSTGNTIGGPGFYYSPSTNYNYV